MPGVTFAIKKTISDGNHVFKVCSKNIKSIIRDVFKVSFADIRII